MARMDLVTFLTELTKYPGDNPLVIISARESNCKNLNHSASPIFDSMHLDRPFLPSCH